MADKPMRPCRSPGCGRLTKDGWCPEHKPKAGRRKQSQAWHWMYATPVWTRELRPAQLLAQPWCAACARRGLRTRATEVDHITPHEGDWLRFTDRANLQSLCHRCHSAKTMRELNAKQGKTGRKF